MFRSFLKCCFIAALVLFSCSVAAAVTTHTGRVVTSIGGPPPQPVPRAIVVVTFITRSGTTETSRGYFAVTTNGLGMYSFIVPCETTPGINYIIERRIVLADGTFVNGPSTGYNGQFFCNSTHQTLDASISAPAMDSGITNAGPTPPCPTQSVGQPVNVTTGNMWTTQRDYFLPGVGEKLRVNRAYNSLVQTAGLFGLGWTSNYDARLLNGGSDLVQIDFGEGRIINFIRHGTTTTYDSLSADFHAQLIAQGVQYQLRLNDGSIYQFFIGGRLLYQQDSNGNQTTLNYNANGKLTGVTDAFGRTLSFSLNPNGTAAQISDAMGTVATYEYYPSTSLLKTVTYNDASKYKFEYTTIGSKTYLTTVKDALDNILEAHQYDSSGRATTSEKQGGVEHYTLDYSNSTFTSVTDGLGRVTKFYFDNSKSRNVITKIEGLCSCGGSGSEVTEFFYDDNLNLSRKVDALSRETLYTYDTNGNRLSMTDANGTVSFTYNQFSEILTRTDQMGGVITNTFNSAGNLLTTKDPLNNTTTFTYNTRGQLLTGTDARGNVTTFVYNSVGDRTEARDPNNLSTFYFFDARSRLTKVRDTLSRNTLYAYDAAGRLNKITHPDSSFVSFTYDLAGRGTAVTDERGNTTSFGYDAAYRLITTTDALNHTTTYGYDPMQNVTSVMDAVGRVTDYEFDDFNRLKKITYPAATGIAPRLFETFAYDAVGNVTERNDTAGRTTSYVYDTAYRLDTAVDAAGQTTTFEHDALSRTTAVTDALHQRYQFSYDAAGRQREVTRAGLSMSYEYDAVGNRTQRTDYNGTVTGYTYDNRNRLTTITYPDRTASYVYDPLNHLTQATNENGTVYISYDNRYRVASMSDPFYYGVSYDYDAAGNRTKTKINGATHATYTYDAVNRLTNVADSAGLNFPHTYDAINRLTSRTAPNGVTTNYSYDRLNRLTALTHVAGPSTLIDNQYTYNDANNISSWTNTSGAHAYEYDLLDRLTSTVTDGQPDEYYEYDGVGNRIASHLSSTYDYKPFNRLAESRGASYSYDSNGNVLTRNDGFAGTTTFTWNEENQLTEANLPFGGTVNYKYDALGRRIERSTNGGASERYIYDGQDVLKDLNADWSVANTYLNSPGIDNHLRQASATTGVAYFLTDHLGSTAGLTDSSANVIEQVTYDSFGRSTGSSLTRYTYTGRELDPDTGLGFSRSRWYDPTVGRFISEDPIGFSGGDLNLYGYVWQNPLRYRDPLGLDGEPSKAADYLDRKIEAARKYLESDPDAVNFNTIVNYTANTYHGFTDLLRVGNGVGNAIYNPCATDPLGDVLKDVGRGSTIALILAGPGAGIAGALRPAAAAAAPSELMLGARAAEIHGALDPIAANMRTTAVMSTQEGVNVIAGGARDLIPAQRAMIGGGEVAARLPGAHAEITALSHAGQNGLTPSAMAVTRTICGPCVRAIQQSGGTVTSSTTAVWPR